MRWKLPLLPLSYSWRNVLARKTSTAITLAGVAVSVMVYVVISATAAGIARVAATSGDPENLVVLSKGASSAESSRLPRDIVDAIRYSPGIARDANGSPMASPELLVSHSVPRMGAGAGDLSNSRYATIRGVTPTAMQVRRRFRLLEGRLPEASGEVIVGRLLRTKLGRIGVGDDLRYSGRVHRVVGIFESGGEIFEGEIWTDLEDLQSEVREREVSLVVVRVSDPRAIPQALAALGTSRRFVADVKHEPVYYEEIQRASEMFIYLGNLISVFMGLGAIVAGMNTMYAAMSGRIREMGTLRALGFGKWDVGGSLLFESFIVGALGGLVGLSLALAFDGVGMNLLGLSFELDVRPDTMLRGSLLAGAIGLLGGLLPARAASRLEIVEALRHV